MYNIYIILFVIVIYNMYNIYINYIVSRCICSSSIESIGDLALKANTQTCQAGVWPCTSQRHGSFGIDQLHRGKHVARRRCWMTCLFNQVLLL